MKTVSIYVRGKSLWVHFSFNGTLYRYPLKLKNNKTNMRTAVNKQYELEDMLEKNILPTKEDVIVNKLIKKKEVKTDDNFLLNSLDYFISSFIISKKYSDRNKAMYNSAYKKFQEVIDTSKLKLTDVNSFHADTFKQYLLDTLSYQTARTYMNYMNIIFNRAIESNLYKIKIHL